MTEEPVEIRVTVTEPVEIRTPFVLDFSGNDFKAGDFRPKVESAVEAEVLVVVEEEVDPKDLSAQAPVSSSSTNQLELELKGTTASVEKVSGQPKVNAPGKLTLPPVTSIGSNEPIAKV